MRSLAFVVEDAGDHAASARMRLAVGVSSVMCPHRAGRSPRSTASRRRLEDCAAIGLSRVQAAPSAEGMVRRLQGGKERLSEASSI